MQKQRFDSLTVTLDPDIIIGGKYFIYLLLNNTNTQ